MEALNEVLGHWEPLWLFVILFLGILIEAATLIILIKEYFYDKEVIEKKPSKSKKVAKGVYNGRPVQVSDVQHTSDEGRVREP